MAVEITVVTGKCNQYMFLSTLLPTLIKCDIQKIDLPQTGLQLHFQGQIDLRRLE